MDTVATPTLEDVKPTEKIEEDDPMVGSGQDDEGEGDDAMGDASDDSSEEPEEDSDAERQVREGFIVDEDEDDDDEAERRRKHKRRRRHRGIIHWFLAG
jgi:transcription elongation factor SPT6